MHPLQTNIRFISKQIKIEKNRATNHYVFLTFDMTNRIFVIMPLAMLTIDARKPKRTLTAILTFFEVFSESDETKEKYCYAVR